MSRVAVSAEVLRWAIDRTGRSVDQLAPKFPRLADWLTGEYLPTLKQLEAFAKATHTSFGFFFLPEPPVERVPIPHFRTGYHRHV
ncbi:MAG: hypothetical protein AMXMBFR13_14260 [Phycisphaerae bacterium]